MQGFSQIRDQNGIYFITFAVVEWVDVFTRKDYANLVVESLQYCQKEKGLTIYAWCIMSNHLHLIVSAAEGFALSAILRDFKKFTSSTILKAIEQRPQESRRNWMLWLFRAAGEKNSKNTKYQFWQQDNHPIALESNRFKEGKLYYLHQNPVVAGLVAEPEHYIYSSATDYAGGKGLITVTFL
jgi:putative transposase